jgi:hypothetical protein
MPQRATRTLGARKLPVSGRLLSAVGYDCFWPLAVCLYSVTP